MVADLTQPFEAATNVGLIDVTARAYFTDA